MNKFEYNKVFYFRYAPLGLGKINIYDQFPLVIPLLIRGPIMLGLNLHWIPSPLRRKFILWVIDFYNRTPESRKSVFHLWYRTVKNTPAIAFAVMGVRKYYINRTFNVVVIEARFWEHLHYVWSTKYKPRFLRRKI